MTDTAGVNRDVPPDTARPPAPILDRLNEPVDGASLAVFRMAFGAIMCWEVARYVSREWIQSYYVTPAFHFQYYGFDWIRPWPGRGMFVHFAVLGAASALVMLGVSYRAAAAVFTAASTYVFLLEQARYLNHFYLICLLGLVLTVVPADRVWSLRPGRSAAVPAWGLWLLRFQVGVPYIYAGVAKLNPDWFRGEPLRSWMAERADLPIVGTLLLHEPVVYLFAYGAVVFDLLIVPALLWRRTRLGAFAIACVFHVMNTQLFTIGVFPYLMIAATTIFFEPAWPRRVLRRVLPDALAASATPPRTGAFRLSSLARAALAAYIALQVLTPLRHWAYPGDVNWTEEGHRFSWRMKLRDKDARATFIAVDPMTLTRQEIDWRPYLAGWQYREMSSRPDMVLQFALRLADDLQRQSGRRPRIHAVVPASLNGRRPELLIDPAVDLAAVRRSLRPAPWIRPLKP